MKGPERASGQPSHFADEAANIQGGTDDLPTVAHKSRTEIANSSLPVHHSEVCMALVVKGMAYVVVQSLSRV